jgi:hypothetical protein
MEGTQTVSEQEQSEQQQKVETRTVEAGDVHCQTAQWGEVHEAESSKQLGQTAHDLFFAETS